MNFILNLTIKDLLVFTGYSFLVMVLLVLILFLIGTTYNYFKYKKNPMWEKDSHKKVLGEAVYVLVVIICGTPLLLFEKIMLIKKNITKHLRG